MTETSTRSDFFRVPKHIWSAVTAEIGCKEKYKSVELLRSCDQDLGKKFGTKKNSNHQDQPPFGAGKKRKSPSRHYRKD